MLHPLSEHSEARSRRQRTTLLPSGEPVSRSDGSAAAHQARTSVDRWPGAPPPAGPRAIGRCWRLGVPRGRWAVAAGGVGACPAHLRLVRADEECGAVLVLALHGAGLRSHPRRQPKQLPSGWQGSWGAYPMAKLVVDQGRRRPARSEAESGAEAQKKAGAVTKSLPMKRGLRWGARRA
jgi:hypothetical protein